eukprot:scaffold9518_cov31-Phaeocystis_antarctica.AAC.2
MKIGTRPSTRSCGRNMGTGTLLVISLASMRSHCGPEATARQSPILPVVPAADSHHLACRCRRSRLQPRWVAKERSRPWIGSFMLAQFAYDGDTSALERGNCGCAHPSETGARARASTGTETELFKAQF